MPVEFGDLDEPHRGNRRGLRPQPAEDHRPVVVAAGVEPVGDAGVAVSDDGPKHPVRVEDGLVAVETGLPVGVVDRLPPEVAERDAPVEGLGRGHFDDQRLAVAEAPRPPGTHVLGSRSHLGERGRFAEAIDALGPTALLDLQPEIDAGLDERTERLELRSNTCRRER